MLANNELKYYSSLLKKKHRQEEKKFLVEGLRIVEEGLNSDFNCEIIIVSHSFADNNTHLIKSFIKKKTRIEIVRDEQFKKLADTDSPQGIASVFNIKPGQAKFNKLFDEQILIYLDNISDPGNLGTILRTADWFGINNVLLSIGSVEKYNPKVIRASMGSVFHLNIIEEFKADMLNEFKGNKFSLICTDILGENLYEYDFPEKFVLIFSNEGNGPSMEIQNLINERITIPKFGNAESLNVASAFAAIMGYLKSEA